MINPGPPLILSRRSRSTHRALRRCAVCFATACVLPVLLVLLVATEQYSRPGSNRRPMAVGVIDEYDNYPVSIDIQDISNMAFGTSRLKKGLLTSLRRGNRTSGRNRLFPNLILADGNGFISFDAIERRMEMRRKHLENACHIHGLDVPGNDSLHKPNRWEFLVNRPHKIVWCNVFKAASTSWMFNFNLLAGYSPAYLKKAKEVPLHLARKRYPRPSLDELYTALNDSISFLIVRHPLERLLSAYRDKLQFSLPHTLHQKLGVHIVNKYRRASKTKAKQPRWPTFEEFVRYLVDANERGAEMDMHWTPITNFCTPCMIRFDVIAKFETLREDQAYLIHKAGLQHIIKPQWKNSGRGRATIELVAEYFSQLTKNQIKQLYHIYRYDFDLFNYTLKNYIDVGKEDPTTIPPVQKKGPEEGLQ